jgi:hypothetical protein
MSIIVNGKLVSNNKWTGISTVVKSLRAEQSFFDMVDLVAKSENLTRNELIVRVVSEYCDGLCKSLATEWEENYAYVVKSNIIDNDKPCEYPFVDCKYLVEKVENEKD